MASAMISVSTTTLMPSRKISYAGVQTTLLSNRSRRATQTAIPLVPRGLKRSAVVMVYMDTSILAMCSHLDLGDLLPHQLK